MEELRNFRFEVWTDGNRDACHIMADMPESKGMNRLSFYMGREDLQALIDGKINSLVDCYTHLRTCGDIFTFFYLDLPMKDSGVEQVKYNNVQIPKFFLRLLMRVAKRVWTARGSHYYNPVSKREQDPYARRVELEFSEARLARISRLYGQGKGSVEVRADEDTQALIKEESARSPQFQKAFEYLKRIPSNSTYAFFQTAMLHVSRDRDGNFYWRACSPKGRTLMNGGLVNHAKDGETPDWCSHT